MLVPRPDLVEKLQGSAAWPCVRIRAVSVISTMNVPLPSRQLIARTPRARKIRSAMPIVASRAGTKLPI